MTDAFTVRSRNPAERLIDGRVYRPVVKPGTSDAGQPLATDTAKTSKDLLSCRPAGNKKPILRFGGYMSSQLRADLVQAQLWRLSKMILWSVQACILWPGSDICERLS